ncbi:MAG: ATP-binding protein [Leptospirillia bacterium]
MTQRTSPHILKVLLSLCLGALTLLTLYAVLLIENASGNTFQAGMQLELVVAALAISAGVCLIAYRIARNVARPLEEAADAATRIGRGEPGHRLSASENEELQALTDVINGMTRQLESEDGAGTQPREELEAVLASMEEGVVAVDTKGRIITLNPAAKRLFGLEEVSYPPRTLTEMVRSPDLLRFVTHLQQDGKRHEIEVTLPAIDGDRRIRVYGTPLSGSDGSRMGSVLVVADVTRIRALETMRRDFVANVSHELKTPITAIHGAVDTLLDGAATDPESLNRFLDVIRRHSDRLGALVNDTLSLARIEQGVEKADITLRPEKLKKLLREVTSICAHQAEDHKVVMRVDCPDGLSLPVDAPLLEQAVVNLVQNAIAYSPTAAEVTIRALKSDDEVVIEVEDQGLGIAAQHLPRLFERFYRVDPARSRDQGGTGLGLAIVKHVAVAHGGDVSVDTTVGQGSCFRIHLPVRA